MATRPRLLHTVLDAPDVRGLAEFWRELMGLHYRQGDEPPTDGTPDEEDWLVLLDADGRRVLVFQEVGDLPRPTWPEPGVAMQLHLDLTVPDRATLEEQKQRVLDLGGEVRLDRTHTEEEPLYAFADPAGHVFCILVA